MFGFYGRVLSLDLGKEVFDGLTIEGPVFDTLILCRFYRDLYQWEQLQEMVNAVTGLGFSREAMVAVARRATDDIRRFNLREGMTRKDDHLPPRFYDEPLPETGKVLSREQMDVMLDEYYQDAGLGQ